MEVTPVAKLVPLDQVAERLDLPDTHVVLGRHQTAAIEDAVAEHQRRAANIRAQAARGEIGETDTRLKLGNATALARQAIAAATGPNQRWESGGLTTAELKKAIDTFPQDLAEMQRPTGTPDPARAAEIRSVFRSLAPAEQRALIDQAVAADNRELLHALATDPLRLLDGETLQRAYEQHAKTHHADALARHEATKQFASAMANNIATALDRVGATGGEPARPAAGSRVSA